MPGKIFVNYRRGDERSMAARVRDRLAQTFGDANVFMDVDNLLAGQRFDRELEKALTETDVFLAVIGPRWMELLGERASGKRDYVREEIAGALIRGITVIPVVVERTSLPDDDALPEDIRELVLHQKHDVTHEQFGRDVAGLVEAIRFARKAPPRSLYSRSAILAALAVVTIVGGALAMWAGPSLLAPGDAKQQPATQAKERAEAEKARQEEVKKAEETERRHVALQQQEEERKRAEAKRKADEDAARRDPALAVKPGSGQSFRDCPDCPEMVVVPAGSFMMGSPASEPERESWQKGTESPQLKMMIARPFAVGKFSVTRGEFSAFVTATGHRTDGGCYAWTGTKWEQQADRNWRSPGFSQDDRHPVVCVNWDDAKAYAAWLFRKTGQSYRLLSEAEREYVTRAGTTTPFWWGSSISPTQANYNGNLSYAGGGSGVYRQKTMPVDSFAANPWGLYNVHGNVREWMEDCWNDSHTGNPGDGSPRETTGECGRRVLHGGSWFTGPQYLRAANRSWLATVYRYSGIGFRLARALSNP